MRRAVPDRSRLRGGASLLLALGLWSAPGCAPKPTPAAGAGVPVAGVGVSVAPGSAPAPAADIYMADGPDGTTLGLKSRTVFCLIEGKWDGGDDTDTTYVPLPVAS